MSDNDDPDAKGPFQIRDFRRGTQAKAKACANRAGLNMAEWMDRAVHTQARVEQGDQILPPDQPGAPQPSGPNGADQLTARMHAVAGLMQGLAAVKQATGRASGRDVVMQALWTLGARMAAIEGAQPPRISKRNRPDPLAIEAEAD
jgi:hypothetical protein